MQPQRRETELELKEGSAIKAPNLIFHISCVLKHFFFPCWDDQYERLAKDTSFHYCCLLLIMLFSALSNGFFHGLVATGLKSPDADLTQCEPALLHIWRSGKIYYYSSLTPASHEHYFSRKCCIKSCPSHYSYQTPPRKHRY